MCSDEKNMCTILPKSRRLPLTLLSRCCLSWALAAETSTMNETWLSPGYFTPPLPADAAGRGHEHEITLSN